MTGRPLRIRVEAAARPDPHLLRAAIAARLGDRPFPTRAEDEIAAAVVAAVRERLDHPEPGGRPWR